MNYKELLRMLEDNRDEKLAAFNTPLANSDVPLLGIRIPVLRQIVKDYYKDDDLVLLQFELNKYIELDILYFSFAMMRAKDFNGQIYFLKHNMKYAKSWMVTDTIITYLKKKTFAEYKSLFDDFYLSKDEFGRRLAYVAGLRQAREKDMPTILEKIQTNETYMVMMGEAWLIATMGIYHPEEVFNYLEHLQDLPLKKKAISKMIESYRIKDEYKDRLRKIR